eukprot:3087535-Ditylum_brightwellii.AAC.1
MSGCTESGRAWGMTVGHDWRIRKFMRSGGCINRQWRTGVLRWVPQMRLLFIATADPAEGSQISGGAVLAADTDQQCWS